VYDPDRDQDDRTLKTGLRLIELVADRATAPRRSSLELNMAERQVNACLG
jgi:hypothetical protein